MIEIDPKHAVTNPIREYDDTNMANMVTNFELMIQRSNKFSELRLS